MGGTSTDVCLILDRAPAPAAEREVGGFTVVPLARRPHHRGRRRVDRPRRRRWALVVGPQSAGRTPARLLRPGRGPRRRSRTPTWWPAHPGRGGVRGLALDPPPPPCGAGGRDRRRRAGRGRRQHGAGPCGPCRSSGGRPAGAGAGGLRRRRAAPRLRPGRRPGMPVVVVPAGPACCPAVGLLTAPRRDLVRSWPAPDDHDGLDAALADLGRGPVAGGGRCRGGGASEVERWTAVDCRYRGQSHELTVPTVGAPPRRAPAPPQRLRPPRRPRRGHALRAVATALRRDRRRPPAGPPRAGVGRGSAVMAEPDCDLGGRGSGGPRRGGGRGAGAAPGAGVSRVTRRAHGDRVASRWSGVNSRSQENFRVHQRVWSAGPGDLLGAGAPSSIVGEPLVDLLERGVVDPVETSSMASSAGARSPRTGRRPSECKRSAGRSDRQRPDVGLGRTSAQPTGGSRLMSVSRSGVPSSSSTPRYSSWRARSSTPSS